MRILLVAATIAEIEPFEHQTQDSQVDVLITGVGMVATTFQVTKKLSQDSYDLVINAGIAGAFDHTIKIGKVVEIKTEQFSELGVEDDANFVSAFELGLIQENEYPFNLEKLDNPDAGISGLQLVDAITVSTVHGNETSIQKIMERCSPQVESMEGGAVAYVCLQEKIRFVQIRAISNYVEKRNKDAWNIALAIANLNVELMKLIANLEQNTIA
ncbi:MAG: futalosine hydrolase [Flavobacteriales bacterium]|nr:futalosine hydrolase [Flavobacteriales bacterium]